MVLRGIWCAPIPSPSAVDVLKDLGKQLRPLTTTPLPPSRPSQTRVRALRPGPPLLRTPTTVQKIDCRIVKKGTAGGGLGTAALAAGEGVRAEISTLCVFSSSTSSATSLLALRGIESGILLSSTTKLIQTDPPASRDLPLSQTRRHSGKPDRAPTPVYERSKDRW